ncbi:MAG: hypothetical protein OHK0023_15040 [Anaerolineae bacterium]
MTRYQAFDPNVELVGSTVFAFITNINHDDIQNILTRHNLGHIDPNGWYKLQDVLNVLSDISAEENASQNLVAIGMAAAQLGLQRLPEEYKNATAEAWLRAYCDTIYVARHRNGLTGTLTLDRLSDRSLRLTMHSPYPDDLMYGVFYAYIRHFSHGKNFILRYNESSPRREHGGEKTIYEIELGA